MIFLLQNFVVSSYSYIIPLRKVEPVTSAEFSTVSLD